MATKRIQTFVVLHQESTKLKNESRTTELCMMAILRPEEGDLPQEESQQPQITTKTELPERQQKRRKLNDGEAEMEEKPYPIPELPRVRNSLLLAVNPTKSITDEATELSDLDNKLLEQYKKFDGDLASILDQFLKRLPAPVCLVAHYGDGYDFPLLNAQLSEADPEWFNSFKSSDLVCADSLDFFVETSKARAKKLKKFNKGRTVGRSGGGKKKLFNLPDVYERRFGKPLERGNCADGKTEALLQLCLSHGKSFFDWADDNKGPLYEVKKMW